MASCTSTWQCQGLSGTFLSKGSYENNKWRTNEKCRNRKAQPLTWDKDDFSTSHSSGEPAELFVNAVLGGEMTDSELELSILRKYVEHHDAVGTDLHKCARELDM